MRCADTPYRSVILGRRRGHPPWSERRTLARFTTRTSLRSKSTRLFTCSLAVMARRAQRTQMLRSIRIHDTLCDQLLSRLREMVGNRCATTAQHTPRVRVQVRAADTRPQAPIRARPRCYTLRGRFLLMGRTASARGQFGAPGDRARGAGLAGQGASIGPPILRIRSLTDMRFDNFAYFALWVLHRENERRSSNSAVKDIAHLSKGVAMPKSGAGTDTCPAFELRCGGLHLIVQSVPGWLVAVLATATGSGLVAWLTSRWRCSGRPET